MKFLSVAVLALTAAAGADAAASSRRRGAVTKAEMNRRMKNGLVDKKTLMQGAKPYGEKTIRKLEQNQQQEFEITGEYSIQFDSCISLTVQNENFAEDGNLAQMAAEGDLISEKDYIMFKVCPTDYCDYYEDDDKLTFITDVGTYFNALSQYLPTKVENYCGGCEEQYDYCYAEFSGQQYYPEGYEQQQQDNQQQDNGEQQQDNGDQQQDNGDQQQDNNNGGRKLEQNYYNQDGQIVRFIDCQICADYECLDFHQNANGYYNENGEYVEMDAGMQGFYDEDGEWVEYGLDDAAEWLNGFSECSETYSYLDNYLLYAGLMCNADGDGIEIGLYMDDQCTLYTPKVAYADVMGTGDQAYYSMISDVVEFTFTNDFECYDPEIVYTNQVDYYYEQQEQAQNGDNQNQQNQDANQEAPEAAEWCQNLVGGNMAFDLYDCGGYEAQDDAMYEADDYATYNTWYQYELYQQQAEDLQAVCDIVTKYDGEFHTVYNSENPGLFNYKKGKNSTSSASGLSGGAVAGIVIVVLAAVGGVAAAMMMKNKGSSDKKKPLINEEGGTLA